ncbi:hypothetical protein [Enterococcus sp. DIV0756]|uniref:hypothetical protein n=1 Tax=Enterococcus sp. DIV0756 TaxID=2774636 RepID=UPI003F23D3C3
MNNFEYLDDKRWSPLWEKYLADVLTFDPTQVHDINCLVPIPKRKGLLVFTDHHVYCSQMTAISTLHEISTVHSFPEYQVLSICLRELGCFGTYKFPWVSPFFTLCPLESKEQTIWLNPYKISSIFKYQGQHFAQMTNGLHLILPVQKRRVIARAELACLLMATMRRGFFHYAIPGFVPLDYLFLPSTPFASNLRNRPMLKKFRTSLGEINHLYRKTYALYHCEEFFCDPQDSDQIDWL